MKILSYDVGLMNNPKRDLSSQIRQIASENFSFVDIVLEPPKTLRTHLKASRIKNLLRKNSLYALGHTWYDMRFAHPIERIRRVYINELKKDIGFFKKIGCIHVGVHIDANYKVLSKEEQSKLNTLSLKELSYYTRKLGLKLLLENVPGGAIVSPKDIGKILKRIPSLGFLLDVGHANTIPGLAVYEFFEELGSKIEHIHLSDNAGQDQHLPIGLGTVDWKRVLKYVKNLKRCKTITLEVFARGSSSEVQLNYQVRSLELLQSFALDL